MGRLLVRRGIFEFGITCLTAFRVIFLFCITIFITATASSAGDHTFGMAIC
jgi:hypothetical protein